MAKNDSEPKKHRRGGGFGKYAYGYIMRPIRLTIMLVILRGVGLIIAIALGFFLLSGGINQVKTGQTLVEYALDSGQWLSDLFNHSAEGNGPLKITEDGIYFQDATPPEEGLLDGQEGLIDGGENNQFEEWKSNWTGNSPLKEEEGGEEGGETETDNDQETGQTNEESGGA